MGKEEDFYIDANGARIYFRMNTASGSKSVAILIHGFTGSVNEHIHVTAAKTFPDRGIDVCRIHLYNGKFEGARRLSEASLMENVADVEALAEWLRERYENIYGIGHSLGGIVAILANRSFSRLVLWDPTTGFESLKERGFEWNNCLRKYISRRRIDTIVSKSMIEEWKSMDAERLADIIEKPVLFIFAKRYNKHESWKEYLTRVKPEKEIAFIDSGHTFTDMGADDMLMEVTYAWLKK